MIRQAFGEESMSHTHVSMARSVQGRTGWLISSTMPDTVAKLQQLVREDQHQTTQDLADEIRICYGHTNRF
jgi:hypothetical protein